MSRVGILLVAIAFSLVTTSTTVKATEQAHTHLVTVTCPPLVQVSLNMATVPSSANLLPASASTWQAIPTVVAAFDRLVYNSSGGWVACFYHINWLGTTTLLFESEIDFPCTDPKSTSASAVQCVVR